MIWPLQRRIELVMNLYGQPECAALLHTRQSREDSFAQSGGQLELNIADEMGSWTVKCHTMTPGNGENNISNNLIIF